MNRYEKYKPSGIDWLPQIPSHWEMSKTKYYFKYTTGFTPPSGQDEFYFGDLIWVTIADMNEKIVSDSINKLSNLAIERFKPDVTKINSLLFSFKLSVGKVAFAGKDLYTNEAIISILPNENYDVRYFFYTLPEQLIQNANENIYGAKMLNQELIRNASICFPPLVEQTAIANFLDEKTEQIDKLISNKHKMIELLKDERSEIIDETLTKGVNCNVRVKSSGFDYIGKIPIHWEVKKLRYLGKLQNGVSKGKEYFGSGFPFVSYGDVYNNEILQNNSSGLALSSEEDRINYSVKEGDVFFTRTSETVDEIGISSTCFDSIENATFSGFLIRFRPYDNILTKSFSKYYFRSQIHRKYFVKEMNIVTRASLSQDLLKNLPILIPPMVEQNQISRYLMNETYRIDSTISKIRKEIELMNEYRTALISEVVTGKVKVV